MVSPVALVVHLRANASFRCNATGIPIPAIVWTRENGQLPKSHSVRNGVLTITELAAVDQGRYTCTATNAAGFQRKTVSVTIEGAFTCLKFLLTVEQTLLEGERVNKL